MPHAAFDTLSAAQRLEKEFGFPPKQAEGTAKLVHDHLVGTVATKDDIAAVKSDVAAVKGDVAAVKGELKAEIAAVKGELKAEIAAVKDDVAAVKSDVAAVKGELKAELRGVSRDLYWIKGICAAVLAALVLPWLTEGVSETLCMALSPCS